MPSPTGREHALVWNAGRGEGAKQLSKVSSWHVKGKKSIDVAAELVGATVLMQQQHCVGV
ncbi:hypothetical protein CBOM_07854 [Ceraceosorus bombacis]|uniref:Uncharacterized protein n=1 Tax=Ceraceosorus bombacis TaxID=401625 RepID=A0A0P1BNV5_9BASI|nr:hypothetical protein CBOM_07854 [Ceraceosorus bombacis]